MKSVPTIIIAITLLTSCATIMNEPDTKTTIHTNGPSKIVVLQDTFQTKNNRVKVTLPRSKEPVTLSIVNDSTNPTFTLKPHNSFAYLFNIVCNYGIGMLVDRNNPKRYTYPPNIYLDIKDTINELFKFQKNRKGELHLHLSLPHVNNFLLKPENESEKFNTGFWGLTLGLDYYHKNNQFLNISATGVADFFVPVPAAVDISGEYELMSSQYLSISNNLKVNKFSVGYGLSYSRNTWDYRYYDRFSPPPPSRDPLKKSSNAMGLIITTYYQTGKSFRLGVIYRPTFYRLNIEPSFNYEHLLSLNFGWRIRLKNTRN